MISNLKVVAFKLKRFLHKWNRLDRQTIASLYLHGSGIEIGALHSPLLISKSIHVKYVDRASEEELAKRYPEIDPKDIVTVSIIDDGERLSKILDGSQDFVIANHFLEHCEDPFSALLNFFRVLKNDGILYLAIPDKRFTFDAPRQTTTTEHILKDYEEGPAWSRQDHMNEWNRLFRNGQDISQCTPAENGTESIHFHVWSQIEMLELFITLRKRVAYDLEIFLKSEDECIFVLRKLQLL